MSPLLDSSGQPFAWPPRPGAALREPGWRAAIEAANAEFYERWNQAIIDWFNWRAERENLTMTHCGKCHTCGTRLQPVLDGESWCQECETYRRYPAHGWVAGPGNDKDNRCPPTAPRAGENTTQ